MTSTVKTPTAALSSDQLDTLRAGLTGDRVATETLIARLESDLESFTGSRTDSATDDEHDPEGPTLAFERSQSSAILDQTRDHLAQIDAALVHLDDPDYGRCATCGQAIPFARLEVRPYSTQCVACAGRTRR